MKRDPILRSLLKKVATSFYRGDVPVAGSLPSSFIDSTSIHHLTILANIVFEAETLIIEEGIDSMNEVTLPYLGMFKFKKGWPIFTKVRRMLFERNHITEADFRRMDNTAKVELMSEFEALSHQAFIDRLELRRTLTPEKRSQLLLDSVKLATKIDDI